MGDLDECVFGSPFRFALSFGLLRSQCLRKLAQRTGRLSLLPPPAQVRHQRQPLHGITRRLICHALCSVHQHASARLSSSKLQPDDPRTLQLQSCVAASLPHVSVRQTAAFEVP